MNSSQVAAEIVDLINASPRSPTKEQIEAISVKVALPACEAGVPRLRAEWDAQRNLARLLLPTTGSLACCSA
jgi:hypothetical protein